jgi:hypothetical protein
MESDDLVSATENASPTSIHSLVDSSSSQSPTMTSFPLGSSTTAELKMPIAIKPGYFPIFDNPLSTMTSSSVPTQPLFPTQSLTSTALPWSSSDIPMQKMAAMDTQERKRRRHKHGAQSGDPPRQSSSCDLPDVNVPDSSIAGLLQVPSFRPMPRPFTDDIIEQLGARMFVASQFPFPLKSPQFYDALSASTSAAAAGQYAFSPTLAAATAMAYLQSGYDAIKVNDISNWLYSKGALQSKLYDGFEWSPKSVGLMTSWPQHNDATDVQQPLDLSPLVKRITVLK